MTLAAIKSEKQGNLFYKILSEHFHNETHSTSPPFSFANDSAPNDQLSLFPFARSPTPGEAATAAG